MLLLLLLLLLLLNCFIYNILFVVESTTGTIGFIVGSDCYYNNVLSSLSLNVFFSKSNSKLKNQCGCLCVCDAKYCTWE